MKYHAKSKPATLRLHFSQVSFINLFYLGIHFTLHCVLSEQFDGFAIPKVSTADVRCWRLNFGQSAWETARRHRCQFHCLARLCENRNIGQFAFLCAARVNEANGSFESRLATKIVANQTSPMEFVVGVVACHVDCGAIERQIVVSAWHKNVLISLVQLLNVERSVLSL